MSQEIVKLTQQLLEAIGRGDWKEYAKLCDPSLTCFEPEAQGNLIEGLGFHHFYFDQRCADAVAPNVTIASPHVRMLGETVAVISYTRLNQSIGRDGPMTQTFEETRVWHRQDGQWKNVHFHRSHPTKARPGRWRNRRDC